MAWHAAHYTRPQLEVDIGPLREAFLRSGLTPRAVARALGWDTTYLDRRRDPPVRRRAANGSRVRRQLGLMPYNPGHGYPKRYRERCSYEMAVKLAHAIGVEPVDVGL